MPRSPAKPSSKKRRRLAESIEIRGARQNNLQGIDLDLPLGKFCVVTGPSGSGKSSLAFDTIYAEGQRRYVETFSPYTRQFFERMDKPKVEAIRGIPPAIAIEQVNNIRSTRSTVGTITEINDYLKMLFPRVAEATCPECGCSVRPESAESILQALLRDHAGATALTGFDVEVPREASTDEFFTFLQGQGYLRVRVFGEVVRTDEPEALGGKRLPAVVMVIQDRLTLDSRRRARLSEAIEASLRLGKGQMRAAVMDGDETKVRAFSTDWRCADCDISLAAPTPGLFSFNNPIGACPSCRGFGRTLGLDMGKAIPDESLSIREGLVRAFQGNTFGESQVDLERAAKLRGVDLDLPFEDFSEQDRRWLIEGDVKDSGDEDWSPGVWYGVRGFFRWLESRTYKMHYRIFLSRFRAYTTCETCNGGRLKPEAYHYRIADHTIADLWNLPVSELLPFMRECRMPEGDHAVALLRDEIVSRLEFLDRAGLSYVHLDRHTRTLSGGELQRVNLTTCLGASLVNTLFVLDEPSIGLHPRDIGRLIQVMEGLRDKGNTLLVVEHEEEVMRAADHLVEIGPGRGEKGGELVYSGSMAGMEALKGSLTADYLTGRKSIPLPGKRRKPKARQKIKVRGARQNNLKKLDVDIPLGLFCCLTGVSGSGKSTLVHEVLYRNLLRLRGEVSEEEPGKVKRVDGHDRVGRVVMVDQSPLARTPRSTPAVYVGAFDVIRQMFSQTDDAKTQGITPGFFSFNSGEGRCERCAGNGFEKIEMQFLSDLFVTCPECEGRRYQPHALKILLHGRSIHEVLQMTIEAAVDWFGAIAAEDGDKPTPQGRKVRRVVEPLKLLAEAGLGYLRLGQPLNTLSGGEAQRLKLVGHLIDSLQAPQDELRGQPLLLLDEPTTGLHFDDIALLVKLLQRLVDEGNSLIVIEHNLDVIQCADWVLDLGPDAGSGGGELVAEGTPEQVAGVEASWTGRYLREKLGLPLPGRKAKKVSYHSTTPTAVSERVAETSEGGVKNAIAIRGAREHNLKNLSLDIPRDEFVVVTGLSGSGKSSLAFDLVFAEGQRRFLDSMSVYARTFVEQMEKPDVDRIAGVPPTVAIEQRISRGGGKSTVATVTEVYHFLRLLFAKLGTQYCPDCNVPVEKQSISAVVSGVSKLARRGALHLMAPLVKARKGFHTDVADHARRQGVETLWVDGEFKPTEGFQKLARFKEHSIDAVIAEVGKGMSATRLRPLVERALEMGKGTLRLRLRSGEIRVLNTEMSCPSCDRSFEELDPRLFSFNSPHGWCKDCRGFGFVVSESGADPRRDDVSQLEAELEEERRLTRGRRRSANDEEGESVRLPCPSCGGTRLNEVARAVQLQGRTVDEITAEASAAASAMVGAFRFEKHEAVIARDILTEITQRLRFMEEVGLGYLQLNRSADTLSGGEAQRIRLAAQLGSNLRGVLYVLDEPTIGLHPRDNVHLLNTLGALRDKGNSLLVVEHDDDTMHRADTIIDLGPGAGRFGGEVVAKGTPKQLLRDKKSVTGMALREPMTHPLRGSRRALPKVKDAKAWLKVEGAAANNLSQVDVRVPIGRLTVVTGVSGSGKSTLMRRVLHPAVKEKLSQKRSRKKQQLVEASWKRVSGVEAIKAVFEVDQSPIGKTSRSCPATYVGVMDPIRKLFAQLPLSRTRGYEPGRFSFNTEGGRCDTCQGNGEIKVEMNFLPTTRMHCEVCNGMRFNAATLEVEFNGKSIGEVLKMSISEAAEFFESQPRIARPLQLLADTGVGYLQLGQASPTLSGGEAQRLKLVTELSVGQGRTTADKLRGLKDQKRNLYLIEEPTIGLHMADVKRLLEILHRMVDEGHTVVVIEHHPDVFAEADYLIDIGPEAGANGGRIVTQGTPEKVATHKTSRTAPFLREVLGREQ